MKMIVATCQFPVSGDIRKNLSHIVRQMRQAHRRHAHVVHFSECALSGYAGTDFKSFADCDWKILRESMERIMLLARRLRVWVIVGANHRLGRGHKPHNSLYVINDRGRLVDRYDKRFCTGDAKASCGDLKHYSPGDHFVTCRIRGIVCGLLICHDFRYPELYREYQRRGVRVMFHSYHNGHWSKTHIRRHRNIWALVVPAGMQTHAASNNMWISANNTTRRQSSWTSFFVRPDGIMTGRLPAHRSGVLISKIDPRAKFYDPSAVWRLRAIQGIYHSGAAVRDRRSQNRTGL